MCVAIAVRDAVVLLSGATRDGAVLAALRLSLGFGDQRGGTVDPCLDPGVDDGLAVEPCLLAYLDVMRPDDRVGSGDEPWIQPFEPR